MIGVSSPLHIELFNQLTVDIDARSKLFRIER